MENAKLGFKKLYAAAILTIIGGFASIIVTKEYWYLGIVFIVVDIIAFFLNLKGLQLMGKDLEGYNKAYKFAIAGIIVDVVSIIICFIVKEGSGAGAIINSTSKALSEAIEFGISFLVLKTSAAYLENKGNTELAKYTNTTKNLLTAAYAITIVLDFIISAKVESWVTMVGMVLAIVALVCVIVGQVRYIIFLKRMSDAI